jgi:hypothetical protein
MKDKFWLGNWHVKIVFFASAFLLSSACMNAGKIQKSKFGQTFAEMWKGKVAPGSQFLVSGRALLWRQSVNHTFRIVPLLSNLRFSMGSQIVLCYLAVGCSNTHKDGVSLFSFLSDHKMREKRTAELLWAVAEADFRVTSFCVCACSHASEVLSTFGTKTGRRSSASPSAGSSEEDDNGGSHIILCLV